MLSDSLSDYAAKRRATVVMTHWYREVIPLPERSKLSVMVLRPGLFMETARKLGGNWHETGEQLTLKTHLLFDQGQKQVDLKIDRT